MSTATPTVTAPPATESVCPPWCAGHRGTLQPWQEIDDGSGWFRDHESEEVTITEGVSVIRTQHELLDVAPSALLTPKVRLRVDDIFAGVDLLTPHQAMSLARALLDAADAALNVAENLR